MSDNATDVPESHRLKVLHVCAEPRGAASSATLGYVRDQATRGWQVNVATPSRGPLGFDARELGARVAWWDTESGLTRGIAPSVRRLTQIVSHLQPDLVHLHGVKAGLTGRLAVRHDAPTVYEPHRLNSRSEPRRGRGALVRWERYATKWTDLTIHSSQAARAQAQRLGIHGREVVIATGVDLLEFPLQSTNERLLARKTLGLHDVPSAVCVGSLTAEGGQADLLLAWRHVVADLPHARLYLVGNGPQRAALQRAADRLDGVRLVGRRCDVGTWLGAANVVVAPRRDSVNELVLLEAMSTGRSVVATDLPGVAELLPARAGEVVAPGQPEEIAAALTRRLLDPAAADEEGWIGHGHVQRLHDASQTTHEVAKIYLRLVGERRAT